ncbi:MAG: hypothetical protein EPO01_16435 [Aquabacterium sp.]|nr:MAG: hypothetical protein EPO01_16435 [Aquabacterium sp.]
MTATSTPALPFFDPSVFKFPELPALSFGKLELATPSTPLEFPFFVLSLMQGTFEAIVNTAIAQMEAYSELMLQATMSVEHFVQSTAGDLPAIQQAAALVEAEPTPAGLAKGINRIVVTDGKPKAKPPARPRKPRASTAGKTVRRTTAKAAAKA